MIALYIILGIFALILLVLVIPVGVWVDVDTEGEKRWGLRYGFLVLYNQDGKGILKLFLNKKEKPEKEKPEKAKKKSTDKKNKKKKKEEKQEEESKPKKKKKLQDILELVQDILQVLPKPLRMLWKGFSVPQLIVGAQVGNFDANACAVAYGRINALVYNGVRLIKDAMRVPTKPYVQIEPAFGKEKTRWIVRAKLHFCILSAVVAAISFGIGYLLLQFKKSRKSKKENKKINS